MKREVKFSKEPKENMGRLRIKIKLIVSLILIMLFVTAHAAEEDRLISYAREVYLKLADAEEKGADTYEAALKLNKALELIRTAGEEPENRDILLSQASNLISEVDSEIPTLIAGGQNKILWTNVSMALGAASIGIMAGFVYFYGPRIFWGTWLRLRKNWKVKAEASERRSKRRSS